MQQHIGVAHDADMDYRSGLHDVLNNPRHETLVRAYNMRAGSVKHHQDNRAVDNPATRAEASAALDAEARKLMAADPKLGYRDAAAKAFKANPELAGRWAGQ